MHHDIGKKSNNIFGKEQVGLGSIPGKGKIFLASMASRTTLKLT
jgi:hypothetical protein